MPRIVLFQPQIPPNTGNVARTCAATACELHLVEPLGFTIDDRQLRRAGLDYWPLVRLQRHPHWEAFQEQRQRQGGRLVLLSSHAPQPYTGFAFRHDDWLVFGRESDGLPAEIHNQSEHRLAIPLVPGSDGPSSGTIAAVRSLNLSVAVGVVLFEALRQLNHGQGGGDGPTARA
jgi:tRNA (cytidine/uridine-2'-O-)-methyltransferase